MFGYIRTHQPELKIGEYEQYCGIYCGLCHRLKHGYGLTAPLALNYDLTFLAVLRLSLQEERVGFRPSRCPLHPFKRRSLCVDTQSMDWAADLTVLLTYHKLQDTVADSTAFLKRLGARFLLLPATVKYRTAAKRCPAWAAAAAEYMRAQAAVEASALASVDAAAEPTARLLSQLCASLSAEENPRRILERFGYCLGRWVYLMDAADDLQADCAAGTFNPFCPSGAAADDTAWLSAARERAQGALNASLAECRAAYVLLEPHRFSGILQNILDFGMPVRQAEVLSGRKAGGKSYERSV